MGVMKGTKSSIGNWGEGGGWTGQKNLRNGKTRFFNLLVLEHLRKIIL